MVPLRFNKAAIKLRERGIDWLQLICEHLKFFTTASFDERAADQVIDCLISLPIANLPHQASDPWAGIRLAERNTALFEQIEHKLEMLQLFDRNGVQLLDAPVKVAILFEIQGGCRRFALQMRMVNEHLRNMRQNFREPISRNLLAK